MSNNEIQQHLGGNTIISCTVRAYPSGTVEWELNGVPIHAPYCGYFEVKKLKYCQSELVIQVNARPPVCSTICKLFCRFLTRHLTECPTNDRCCRCCRLLALHERCSILITASDNRREVDETIMHDSQLRGFMR